MKFDVSTIACDGREIVFHIVLVCCWFWFVVLCMFVCLFVAAVVVVFPIKRLMMARKHGS